MKKARNKTKGTHERCNAMQCNAMQCKHARARIFVILFSALKKKGPSLMLTGYVPTHVVRNHFIYFPCSRDLWSHKTSLFFIYSPVLNAMMQKAFSFV
jgi:hypothetical protein